jgi:GTP diphosphokinase / guanosine-3',5'-bis(diphosphate) 3'-diphosphatase
MVESLTAQFAKEKISFKEKLKNLTLEGRNNVMLAYDIAEKVHDGEFRDNGKRFFDHPLHAAMILIDECKITNPVLLVSSILHDVVENTGYFDLGITKDLTHEQSRAIQGHNMADIFGEEVAGIVISLSKPKIGKDLVALNHQELDGIYRQRFVKVSVESLLVKMVDKLHNLREIYSCSLKRQQGQIEETENFYLPLFKKVLEKYPKEGRYLLGQINLEISKWKTNNAKN